MDKGTKLLEEILRDVQNISNEDYKALEKEAKNMSSISWKLTGDMLSVYNKGCKLLSKNNYFLDFRGFSKLESLTKNDKIYLTDTPDNLALFEQFLLMAHIELEKESDKEYTLLGYQAIGGINDNEMDLDSPGLNIFQFVEHNGNTIELEGSIKNDHVLSYVRDFNVKAKMKLIILSNH